MESRHRQLDELTMRTLERHDRASGFTLVEVMIALAVLGVGILALSAMQVEALQQGSAGRHTADASATARSYLEQVHRLDWATLTAARDNGAWTNVFWSGVTDTVNVDVDMPGAGNLTSTEQAYDVRWTVTDVTTCLRDVQIRVSWDEEGRSAPKSLILATRRYNWGDAGC
jgi:prepilin-type N-terminal cleavage/methylation domain-containing protein